MSTFDVFGHVSRELWRHYGFREMWGAPEPVPEIPPWPVARTDRERMLDQAVRNTGLIWPRLTPWWDLPGIYPDESHVPSYFRDIRAEFWRLHGMAGLP